MKFTMSAHRVNDEFAASNFLFFNHFGAIMLRSIFVESQTIVANSASSSCRVDVTRRRVNTSTL
jgi:hypothetical protein